MRGTITPLPQYVFMARCLVKQRDNFTFTFYCKECIEERSFGIIRNILQAKNLLNSTALIWILWTSV